MESAFEIIWALARQVPYGRVVTYGQLARLAGNPRWARVAGYAMAAAPADVPCHRVVSRDGGLSPAFSPDGRATHRARLEAEGVAFTPAGKVDMERFSWLG